MIELHMFTSSGIIELNILKLSKNNIFDNSIFSTKQRTRISWVICEIMLFFFFSNSGEPCALLEQVRYKLQVIKSDHPLHLLLNPIYSISNSQWSFNKVGHLLKHCTTSFFFFFKSFYDCLQPLIGVKLLILP